VSVRSKHKARKNTIPVDQARNIVKEDIKDIWNKKE